MGTNALNKGTGSGNLALGRSAGASLTSGSNNVAIANVGVAGESGRIRIGTAGKQVAAFLAGVYGVVPAGTKKTVVVNANGQLGTTTTAAARSASSDDELAALRAENRRQGKALRRQQRELDSLRREMEALKGR